MKRRNLFSRTAFAAMLAAGLSLGSGQTDSDKPKDGKKPEAEKSEHAGETADSHDVPLTKAEIEALRKDNETYAVAISHIQAYRDTIRDGAIWVVVVLFIFLWNFRTSIITLTAMPLSILVTALIFKYFNISINTMTLGGLAVAIGELVDDSIVDIENIYRRLKENRQKEHPEHPLKVIFLASSEIRNSIVYATLIVILVVFPLFSLAGLEGRMFAPLGLSYLLTLLSSLVVSLTITPVLASYLLPRAKFIQTETDPFLLRWLKWADAFFCDLSYGIPPSCFSPFPPWS